MTPEEMRNEIIRLWMDENWRYCRNRNGAVDLGVLAEMCAHSVGKDSWLDDPEHPVWDIATEYDF